MAAVDHEGEAIEVFAMKTRGRRAALKFPKRTMKRHGRRWSIVTDRLWYYSAAMKALEIPNGGNAGAGSTTQPSTRINSSEGGKGR